MEVKFITTLTQKKWEVYHDETGAPAGEYDTEYEALKADADINNRYIKSNTERRVS